MNDGRDSRFRSYMLKVVFSGDHCLIFIMGNADIFFSGDRRPLTAGASGCRMLKRTADDIAAFRRTEYCSAHQAKKKFSSAFPGKHHTLRDAKEGHHVFACFIDDADQFPTGGVVPTLVIRNGGEMRADLHNGFQRQRAARIFKKDTRPLIGALINVMKTIPYLLQ